MTRNILQRRGGGSPGGAIARGSSSYAISLIVLLAVGAACVGGMLRWYSTILQIDAISSQISSSASVRSNHNGATSSTTSNVISSNTEPAKLVTKQSADVTTAISNSFNIADNSQKVKEWRKKMHDACKQVKKPDEVINLAKKVKEGFVMPKSISAQPRDNKASVKCKRVVLDFGANIGDTSGKVIDAGLRQCSRKQDLNTESLYTNFNVERKQFEESGKRNPVTMVMAKMMEKYGPWVGPEDYCYYGIEGNPVFTKRLQEIEDYVMAIQPRPIQHMHFYTESVGAGQDGMTKLYLDTVNTKQNFWGSSIFQGHQDVRKSAQNSTSGTIVAADVMGYTIGALMRRTLLAFDETALQTDKEGSHLVLKVDIEGGEYPLLHQAVENGTLCEFAKMGYDADLFIEFHSHRVTGNHEWVGKNKVFQEKLEACGVKFRNLQAWWA